MIQFICLLSHKVGFNIKTNYQINSYKAIISNKQKKINYKLNKNKVSNSNHKLKLEN